MFKKTLAVLSLVALMAISFSIPVAAEDPPVQLPWSTTDHQSYSYSVEIIPGRSDGDDTEFTYEISAPGVKFFYGASYLLPFTMPSGWGSAELTIFADSNQEIYISTTDFNDTSNPNYLNTDVTGMGSIPIYVYEEGEVGNQVTVLVEVNYSFNAPILSSDYSHHFDNSGLGIDGNGNIFDGMVYVDSWGVIDFPLEILADFQNSVGYITSFNISAPGLFIEVQGLYTYMSNNNSLSFYDWIGESLPVPGEEEMEREYYWYITLTGSAGWYDLQIWADYV
jgi:hypothetical protein